MKKPKPIGSTRFDNGHLIIKIEQPNVWEPYARYAYKIFYPNDELTKNDIIYQLDGNLNNFEKNNLVKMSVSAFRHFVVKKGYVEGNPQATLNNIILAKIAIEIKNRGRKLGICNSRGVLKTVAAERDKKLYERRKKTEDYKKKQRENKKRFYEKLKLDPIRLKDYKEENRKRSIEYYYRKKEEKKNGTLAKNLD